MIDHIDVCLCICKMTIQRSSLKFIINVIQIDTCMYYRNSFQLSFSETPIVHKFMIM